MKLLEIEKDYAALLALLEETGGEITPENETALDELFVEMQKNVTEKADGYCVLIKALETRSAALKEREEIFATDRRVTDRRVDWLRDRLKEFGINSGLLTCSEEIEGSKKKKPGQKIETVPHGFKVGIQFAGKRRIEVDEDNPNIPDEYLIYEMPKIDKKKIEAALASGVELPFARYADRTISLTIK